MAKAKHPSSIALHVLQGALILRQHTAQCGNSNSGILGPFPIAFHPSTVDYAPKHGHPNTPDRDVRYLAFQANEPQGSSLSLNSKAKSGLRSRLMDA